MSERTQTAGDNEPVMTPPAVEGAPGMTDLMVTPESIPTPGDDSLPPGLRDVDPAKLAEIREKLSRFMDKKGKTVSGSEDPDSLAVAPTEDAEGRPLGEVMKGTDVDWSEYDLEYSVRHLYPRAMFRDTPEGPKWVAMLDEFYSTDKEARSHGKQVNASGSTDGSDKEPLNLGEYLTNMVNSDGGWSIASILPSGLSRTIVLFRRQTAVVLPDPKPLKKAEEVEAPKDVELQQIEDAALQFAANEGLTPEVQVEDTQLGTTEVTTEVEDLSSRFLAHNQAEAQTEEGGAIVARDTGSLVRQALDRAAPLTEGAPVPAGIQPEAFEDDRGQKHAAGVVNIALGMRNILEGEDFGEVK